MGIFLKHIFRNIKENVGRTAMILISLFGIGILISVAIGILFSADSLLNAFKSAYGSNGYQYMVNSTTEEELSIDRVNQLGYDFDYLGVAEYNYGYIFDKKENKYVSSPFLGLNLEKSMSMGMIDIDTKNKILLEKNDVIISKTFATKYGLKENDLFEYIDEDGIRHEFNVKYIAKDKGAFMQGVSIITSEENYIEQISIEKIKYDFICVKYNGKENISSLTEKLYYIEEDYGLDFVEMEIPSVYDILGSYIKIGIIGIILIMVVVFFTINSIVKIIMNERIPIIGTFRSVGASSKKMNRLLILEMATYGAIGGLAGSFVGVGLTKGLFMMFEMFEDMMEISIEMASFEKYSFYIVLITTLFIILFQILLSISEIFKINKISIKDCVFNKNESNYTYSKTKILFGILFLMIGLISLVFIKKLTFIHCIISIISIFISIALLLPYITRYLMILTKKNDDPVIEMSKSTIINNKLQISSNIIMCVMMCISLITVSLLFVSINNYNNKLEMVKSDLYVSSSYENKNVFSEIAGIEGVINVGSLYTSNFAENYSELYFANHKMNSLNIIYSDSYENLIRNSNVLDIDPKMASSLKNNEVILSNYFKNKYSLKVGDIVVLKGVTKYKRFSDDTYFNLKIVAFSDMSKINNNSVIISSKLVDDNVLTFDSNKYFININENDMTNVKKHIFKSLTYQMPEVYSQSEYVESIKSSMYELYKTIIILILIIVSISLIGIINNETVSFMKRRKEFAILNSTAMSKKQINRMILKELLYSNIVSAVVSIIFTLGLIKILVYTIEQLGMYIPITFKLFYVVILLIIIVLIMLAIYLIMKKKIKKMNIVEELKYE